jgi:hypothetical protein
MRKREDFPMRTMQRVSHYALMFTAAIMLAACAGQREPAQKLIADIESTLAAASAEAAKYVPDQLADIQGKVGALKASFDKQDYEAVVTGAPAVQSAAQNLAMAAAVKKDEVLKSLNDEWTVLAGSLPGDILAIQARIEQLSKKSSKKLPADVDLGAAKAGVGAASSLWSKAQAAFAAGNLDEAVSAAKDVKVKIEAAASSLQLTLPAAAPAH